MLDLEVASAGEPGADLMKLALELRSLPFDWWTPLCAGYGAEPEWPTFKLWLLAAGEASWTAHGPLDLAAELRRVLGATTWNAWLKGALA